MSRRHDHYSVWYFWFSGIKCLVFFINERNNTVKGPPKHVTVLLLTSEEERKTRIKQMMARETKCGAKSRLSSFPCALCSWVTKGKK